MTNTPLSVLDECVSRLRAVVTAAEPILTALDEASGDGDFGKNLEDGLSRVTHEDGGGIPSAWGDLRRVFLDEVGGTSGPLFGLLFQALDLASATSSSYEQAISAGLCEGLAAIQRVGEAEVGDRTLVDALSPAVTVLTDGGGLGAMLEAAIDGAIGTASMRARRGRASYVGDRALGHADPGAVGVALLLSVLAEPSIGVGQAAHSRDRLLAAVS
jgi:dihydroxyacetone kinase-like protein